jgi:RNA polymerase sigma-70 factor, ECF subfamily
LSPKRPARLSFFTYHPRTPIPEEMPVEEVVAPIVEEAAPVVEQAVEQIVEQAVEQTLEQTVEQLAAAPAADEAALVELARTDPVAFGQLYERYVDRVYSYIYHRVGNVQDAEDLTARTFYRALDKLETYEDRGLPFSAWLFRIAHNLVANWHRDHSQRRFLSLDRLWWHSEDGDTPEEYVAQSEEQEALLEAISRLPEERRSLIQYKFGTSLSNLEIGALMNKSESAIKSLYFRTLSALRQDLESRGWGGGAAGSEPEPDAKTPMISDAAERSAQP